MKRQKVLLVASAGGHLIQLHRLLPAFSEMQISVATTKCLEGTEFFVGLPQYRVIDSNFNNKLRLMKTAWQVLVVLMRVKPDIIVSTGAAPGVLSILLGRVLKSKCIWIDSIANGTELSKAGRLAKKLTPNCYSQWEDVARVEKVKYLGSVI